MLTVTRLTYLSPETSKLYNYTLFMQDLCSFKCRAMIAAIFFYAKIMQKTFAGASVFQSIAKRLILKRFKALSFMRIYIVSSLNSYCSTSKGKTPYGLLRRTEGNGFSFPQIFYNKKSNNLITFMKHSINYFNSINVGLVVYD